MKRLTLIAIVAILAVSALAAHAGTYTFQPNGQPDPADNCFTDLWDLDHYYYYSWGINWSAPAGETITGAKLSIKSIYNWQRETNILHVNLLDNPKLGTLKAGIDNSNSSDFFGTTTKITSFVDSKFYAQDWSYTLTTAQVNTLKSYLSTAPGAGKATFGFGFDPDCHYYNCGITCTITTSGGDIPQSTVPEPMSIMLGVLGMGTVAGFRRLRRI